jgi:cytochrome P450
MNTSFATRSEAAPLTRFSETRLYYFVQDQLAHLLSDPSVLRATTFGLRQVMPVLTLGDRVIVTRYPDVLEVLDNPSHFHVAEIYGAAMARTSGDFILGMDEPGRYDRENTFLQSAIEKSDLARVRSLVKHRAQRLLADARPNGVIDVASGYAHKIALTLVAEYFGVPGPDETTLARWMRTIFWDIFLNLTNLASVSNAALSSARELAVYLDSWAAQVRKRLSPEPRSTDTFFERLLRKQAAEGHDDDFLRRNIGGVIIGAVDTVSKAIVHAIEQLLKRPTELANARRAAQVEDDDLVAAYTFEALRFNPHNPIILRHCARDFRLARGTDREQLIRKGSTVYASTISAMFDDAVLQSPHKFRTDRPWNRYVHFGHGMHRCFGERFNRVTIPQAVKALLLCPELSIAHDHSPEYEGPFPIHFRVRI